MPAPLLHSPELRLEEFGVKTPGRGEFVVLAAFDQPAILDHKNDIGGTNRGKPMRNDNRCLSLHQTAQRFKDKLFRLRVETRTRLIQKQYGRISNHRTRDRDPLPLTAGERHAALADQSVVPLRHLVDKFARVGDLRRANNLRPCRVGLAVSDVLPDRSMK